MRLEHHPDAMRIRRATVEHPFGTLKVWMGSTHFLTKTLDRVSTEMSPHVLAYNMKRMMNILGTKTLTEAIRGQRAASGRSGGGKSTEVLEGTGAFRVDTCDQHSVHLPIWTDHIELAANIDKLRFLVECDCPGISFPNTEPDMTTPKLAHSLMNLLHQ